MQYLYKRGISLVAICLVILYSCKTHYKLADENTYVKPASTSEENGKNLALNVCGGCHNNESLHKFVGQQMKDLPKYLGKVYSANITDSKTHGRLHNYTDAQLAYLIKTGIKSDGRFIPYMIRPTMADDDVNDIIAYLHSGDALVTAGDTTIGITHLSLLGKIANHTQKPQPYITGTKRPDANDAVANGRYLVDILSCYHCHSKGILSLNYTHPEDSKGYMQGGMKFKNMNGVKVRASNLTPDKETGIGDYTKEGFRKAVRDGVAQEGNTLNFPMPRYHHLTDKQVDDIYVYLLTLPPKKHDIE